MPRKKKPAAESKPKATYHQSKNGRYYKKFQNANGKTMTRFCCAAEAVSNGLGSKVGSGSSIPKKRKRLNKTQSDKECSCT